ncbi:MAG: PhoU domain-containing protein [Thermoplasmata archaeon]
MEARKVQVTGGSTYIVSLPKLWARNVRLKAGDTVFLEPLGDTLVLHLRGHNHKDSRTKVLQVDKGERQEHVLRKLIGAYVTGYRFIELRFPSSDAATARGIARDFTRMVIGAEIVEETGGRVLIQDLADPMELSPDKCLRRMYMTVRSMVEDSMEALMAGDSAKAADVPPRDQDVDRLYWMVAKQYHLAVTDPSYLATYSLREELHHFRIAAKALERIGDHGERIASAILELEANGVDARLLQIVQEASRFAVSTLDRAFKALMGNDLHAANEAVDAQEILGHMTEELSNEVRGASGVQMLPLATVVDSISRIGGYASDIAEVAINHVVGRED